jgi:ribose transport system substrate-binding protein
VVIVNDEDMGNGVHARGRIVISVPPGEGSGADFAPWPSDHRFRGIAKAPDFRAEYPGPRNKSAGEAPAGPSRGGKMPKNDKRLNQNRRGFMQAAAAGAALFGIAPALAAEMGEVAGRSSKPLRAAFSNAGLQATWCAQGKRAAEYWGKLFNVEVTWFDGELSAPKQRAAVDDMASQKWDFVAIQAFGIGTLTAPVNKMIAAGTPVIDMDTLIAPLDQIKVHSFLAPDNEFMGASVTQSLVDAINGEGTIVMTQGALGHTGAQGRARGFTSVVKKYPKLEVLDTTPADWDVAKTARIWETLLTKYPKISAAYFHNDDMALAAYNVMKAHNRTNILIGGCDAMPPALEAVLDGRMHATVRNPSCRIHGGAIVAGVAAVVGGEKTGPGGIPQSVVTDGPVVTKANAPGMLWMEKHYLI